jgi:hypothetical protein
MRCRRRNDVDDIGTQLGQHLRGIVIGGKTAGRRAREIPVHHGDGIGTIAPAPAIQMELAEVPCPDTADAKVLGHRSS